MPTQTTQHPSAARAAHTPPVAPAAMAAPLTGIERLMAEALMAPGPQAPDAAGDPGAIEYASWIRLLHRSTP